jgi:uncharacterized protein (TIGR02145 family)
MNMSITSNQRPFILLGLIAFGLVTCQKKATSPEYNNPYDETSTAYVPTPNLNTAPISDILALSAKSGGTFENDYGKPVTAKGVCWSLTENPTVGGSCTNEGPNTTSFASNLTGLLADTLYYARAYATNEAGTIYGGQRIFRTKDGIATFGEVKSMSVLAKSATLWMVVTGDGTAPITRKGFVWAEGSTPTLADSVAYFGQGLGSATRALSNLKPGTEYHMRAFTESVARLTYSAPVVFTTQTGQPQFSGLGVSAVTSASSTISVTIDADGGDAITARGVCYSKQPDPTTADTCASDGSGTGSFSVNLTGLERATAYFVRPYATNTVMTGYGAQVSFVTSAVLPTVTTGSVSGLGANTAILTGEVTSDGGSPQTNRGICYATTQNPTIANTCVASGTGAGAFEATMTGLSMGTTYYARAYSTNPIGTNYGSQVSFTTLTGPTVTTGTVSNLTSTSAAITGTVSSDGGSSVSARGICYSTSQNPTISGTCVASGTGTGSFTANLSGLAIGTTYYVRAYATNAVTTSYGTQSSFTTLAPPTVTTGAVSNITSTGAAVSGNVTATGGATVTSRGVCYATTQNPTTSGTCLSSGSGSGSFTATISSLNVATTYFVRAYATNSIGTSYGFQLSFATLGVIPTVSTEMVSNISSTGVIMAGNVSASGSAPVTSRGVCYSTSQNPALSGSCVASGTGTGSFTASLTGLTSGTTYYARAYATNNSGTAFGNQVNFTTLGTPPVTDIDGNVYQTVQIGTQVWMASNLRTTRYQDGSTIPVVSADSTWEVLTSGAWVNYENNTGNAIIYGNLYNWYVVNDSRNVCPVGWHVPYDGEWTVLSNYLGSDAGSKMKQISGWEDNGNGSNSSGFSALPGGFRLRQGSFGAVGTYGYFWSSTEIDSNMALIRFLFSGNTILTRAINLKTNGLSVRCIRN